jgi:hypothetical protein
MTGSPRHASPKYNIPSNNNTMAVYKVLSHSTKYVFITKRLGMLPAGWRLAQMTVGNMPTRLLTTHWSFTTRSRNLEIPELKEDPRTT